jgi:hypothetical protein
MSNEAPLLLRMEFSPESDPAPIDAGDVLQSFDDLYWLARMYYLPDQDQPARVADEPWLALQGPHGTSPLTVRYVRFGSPLEVVVDIGWPVVSGGLIWVVLGQIERVWHMPARIRVESQRLKADEERHKRVYWDERLASEQAEEKYWLHRRASTGRHLQGPPDPPVFRGTAGRLTDGDTPAPPPSPPANPRPWWRRRRQ